MSHIPQSINNLINHFAKLPGIGQKTASRLTYYLLHKPEQDITDFGNALINLKKSLHLCQTCFNYAETNPCHICQNNKRDQSIICVVEQPLDILAIEKTHFNGLYHVLHGALSPIDGISPEHLTLEHLKTRVGKGTIQEVIIATNPTLEGEATSTYIHRLLENQPIKISRLGFGIPMGVDLEYTDEITLAKAMDNRK